MSNPISEESAIVKIKSWLLENNIIKSDFDYDLWAETYLEHVIFEHLHSVYEEKIREVNWEMNLIKKDELPSIEYSILKNYSDAVNYIEEHLNKLEVDKRFFQKYLESDFLKTFIKVLIDSDPNYQESSKLNLQKIEQLRIASPKDFTKLKILSTKFVLYSYILRLKRLIINFRYNKYLFKRSYKTIKIRQHKRGVEQLKKSRNNPQKVNLINRRSLFINSIFDIESPNNFDFFNIDIRKLTTNESSELCNGKDSLVITAQEIISKRNIDFENSYLYSRYNEFKPKSYGEAIGIYKSEKLNSLPCGLSFAPWLHELPLNDSNAGVWGPAHITFIEMRFLKIRNTITNIESHGYMPSNTDVISGYILKNNNDYRFIITQGRHRASVLAAIYLNSGFRFKYLTVKYDKKRASKLIYSRDLAHEWPGVKSGFLSIKDSLMLFDNYFQ